MTDDDSRALKAWSFIRLAMTAILVVLLSLAPAGAQEPEADEQVSPQVAEFLRLLKDPSVQAWIGHRTAIAPSNQATAGDTAVQSSPVRFLDERLAAVRRHLVELAAAIPTLPTQLGAAATALASEFERIGIGYALYLVTLFIAMGSAFEWLARRAFMPAADRFARAPIATLGQLAGAVGARLAYEMSLIAAFALGGAGSLLIGQWPSLLRETAASYLLALTALRAARALARFVLSPDDGRLALLPIQERASCYWYNQVGLVVGWLAFGWLTVELLGTLGITDPGRQMIGYALGLGLVIAGCAAVWRRPASSAVNGDIGAGIDGAQLKRRKFTTFLLSAYIVLIWSLWLAGMMGVFWLAVIAWALPTAIRLSRQATGHILRTTKGASAAAQGQTLSLLLLERGLRAALVIAAAFILIHVWHIDSAALMESDTTISRLVRGALTASLIVVVADLAWRVVRALIDGRIAAPSQQAPQDMAEERRRSRMRTLLPILRNVVFVVLIAIAALMVLAAMGFEIAPLIAGAGVVGVAVGFGAQTLVKDIISGMFYLLDDAFRVGEYIQSGDYKGTVESFSLRSIKLRHHRGPLYTVPFGELGAVENMSRDWVIDKITIGVTYDTDLDKARKLIKQVGKQLAEDPEHKPNIIEPLKMQGVEQFGDFAIQLRMKMICKPGEQFVIRRKAYALIKQSFDANGIKFASPTVRVAGGEAPVAAAQHGARMAKLAAQAGST